MPGCFSSFVLSFFQQLSILTRVSLGDKNTFRVTIRQSNIDLTKKKERERASERAKLKLLKRSERTETVVCYNSFSYLADKSTFLADVTVDMKTIQSRIEKKN